MSQNGLFEPFLTMGDLWTIKAFMDHFGYLVLIVQMVHKSIPNISAEKVQKGTFLGIQQIFTSVATSIPMLVTFIRYGHSAFPRIIQLFL